MLACSALARLPNVSLYAACSEYAAAYAKLLGKAEPLQVHPCFLGDWRQRPARAEQPAGLVLAYVGEIKQEKGFIDLPARLAAMLRDGECRDQRFVVQVTEARTPTAREILGKLHAMAGPNRGSTCTMATGVTNSSTNGSPWRAPCVLTTTPARTPTRPRACCGWLRGMAWPCVCRLEAGQIARAALLGHPGFPWIGRHRRGFHVATPANGARGTPGH